jgi:hypothetical protein
MDSSGGAIASTLPTDKLNHDHDVTTTGAAMSRHDMLFPEIPCRFENCKACYRPGLFVFVSSGGFFSAQAIASKEARETNYWLRLFRDSNLCKGIDFSSFIQESEEIIKILTSIVKTSQKTS